MLKMNTNLYNHDGSLHTEAQLLVSGKPCITTAREWRKRMKDFRQQLSAEDLEEFEKINRIAVNARYYANNSEKVKLSNSKNKAKDLEKTKIQNAKATKKYRNKRMTEDSKFRFFANLRTRCYQIVKDLALKKKPNSTLKWVGCTSEELTSYFESLFSEGMSWDNYGEWHVDHIRPVSSFKQEEWEQINHYSNLQPLWAEDNIKKSNKY
jgi:hypothetical protein